ncbi:glucokinase [Planctomycetota bacterium]|nr:ROK family protein [Planctomycetota bacterium]MSR37931.1 ROK family protein [Planctomycetota bacterium]GDY03222.1 glucokinase [Planctomycetota bacterium]
MKTVLAGDIGGTKCRFALITEDLQVLAVQQVATSRDRAEFLHQLEAACRTIVAAVPAGMNPPSAIGLGTAGVIPRGGRLITSAPNLPLDGFPLSAHLERSFGLPTTLINDGRASAFGEYLRGYAKGSDPLLCLFFGTGVGIGLLIGRRPFEGADNAAGEIGHTMYRLFGRKCPCGQLGHFEAYCGGRAITERAAAEIGPAQNGGEWTVGAVVASQHPSAELILRDAFHAAATLTANACTLLNPGAVVLGGGVLSGWPALRGSIEQFVRDNCSKSISQNVRFVETLGGSDAILWGAAAATGALALTSD